MSTTTQPPAGDAVTTESNQRFHDGDPDVDPQDATDPGSLEHETDESYLDTIIEKWYLSLPILILLSVGVLLFLSQLVKWIPELLSSTRFQLFAGASFLVGVTFWWADSRRKSLIREKEWLRLKHDNNDDVEWWIEYIPPGRLIPPRAVLMKDAGRFGTKSEPLQIKEFDQTLAREWASKGPEYSEDDPAIIWLAEPFLEKNEADSGTSYMQATSGIEVDAYGDTAVLAAKAPEKGGKEQIMQYQSVIRALQDEVTHLQSKEQRLQRHLAEMKEIDDPIEDRINQFIKRAERVMYSPHGRRNSKRTGDERDPLVDDLEGGLFDDD